MAHLIELDAPSLDESNGNMPGPVWQILPDYGDWLESAGRKTVDDDEDAWNTHNCYRHVLREAIFRANLRGLSRR